MIVERHPMAGRWLSVSGRVTLGRHASDIVMPDPEVSRAHAVLDVDDVPPTLEDTGSMNGTWVNGSRIQKVDLHDGDKLRFGHTVWQVVDPVDCHRPLTATGAAHGGA